ncbi:GNAT family N-acetyltransferase [Paenarthrobacter sp. NPDC090522]|uniref:GNAT family N-acetyltransferase n=1 Tax=Paenarthrobacter sp. NPDC090522 TaxID=3364383 RepID=UPI00381C26A2
MTSSNVSPSNRLTVERINVPPGPDADVSADFLAFHRMRVAHETALWGTADRAPTLAEDIMFWLGNEYEERHVYLARLGGTVVGSGTLTLPLSENTTTAGVDVLVDAGYRRRGFGTAILQHLEDTARARDRVSCDGYCGAPIEAGVPLVDAKSGSGGFPLDSDATGFALRHGYSLEQVESNSTLSLPPDGELLASLESGALTSAQGYSVIVWQDRCPDGLVEAFAALKSLMSTEVPIAGLGWEGEDWDSARVRQEEATWRSSGIDAIVAAARHDESGELAAYTVLIHRAEAPAVVYQEDTLVAPGHRGHRLGMLVKIANLRQAGVTWPDATWVMTWNASENRHMLAINIALGFKPSGLEGEWQKRLG